MHLLYKIHSRCREIHILYVYLYILYIGYTYILDIYLYLIERYLFPRYRTSAWRTSATNEVKNRIWSVRQERLCPTYASYMWDIAVTLCKTCPI